MKKYFFVFLLIVCLFISGCSGSKPDLINTPTVLISTPTIAPQSNPTVATVDEKNAILEEIQQIAAEYDRIVEDEKKKGNLIQTTDQATGEESYRYQGKAESELITKSEGIIIKISDLNEKYLKIFGSQINVSPISVPNPRPTSQEEIQQASDQATTEYGLWMKDEEKSGITVHVFDFSQMKYLDVLIGDSYVRSQLKWDAVLKYQLALKAPPADEQVLNISVIHALENGDVNLVDTGNLMPFYRGDRVLNQYETTHWTYIIDTLSHEIIQIAPKDGMTLGNEIVLSGDTLEEKARNFIKMVAPDVNLDSLTSTNGQKEPNFFFRWENHNSSLLDDGRSYPFIQVAIDAQGNFLNYYNTLPFSR